MTARMKLKKNVYSTPALSVCKTILPKGPNTGNGLWKQEEGERVNEGTG